MTTITKERIIPDEDSRYPKIGYRNIFREGVVSVSTETASGPKENAYDGFTYDFWRASATTDQYIQVQGAGSGTLQAGWNDRVKLSASASAVKNAYKGMKIRLTAGPSAGQERLITSYDPVNKVAYVDEPWSEFDVNPSFMLPLADLGSGAVDLTPLIGTGSATFTRATTATTVNSAGLIIPVSSGVARSYYDPTTLEYRGYLAEGARTNLLLRSNWQGASAGSPGTAPTGWTLVSLTGTQTLSLPASIYGSGDGAEAIGFSTTGGRHYVEQTISVTNGTTYTISSYIESLSGNIGRVFNISAGTGTVDSGLGPVPSATGRISFSFTATSTGTVGVRVGIGTTGDSAASSVIVSRPQLEAGTFPSTYIPTVGSAVTRNADVLTYPFAGNADATVGTCYAELGTFWTTSPVGQSLAVSFGGSTGAPLTASGSSAATALSIFDGTTVTQKTSLSSMATGVRKRASAWGGAGILITGDGLTVASAAFDGAMPSTTIEVGCAAGGTNQWNGTIKNVRIWQTQFTAAQLQAITSPSNTYYPIPNDDTAYKLIPYSDYLAIAAHTLAGATITPQHSSDGNTWTDLDDSFIPDNNDPIIFEYEGVWDEYFRLFIDDAVNPISIGAIHCGQKLTMERGLPVGWKPPELNEDIEYTNTISEGGQIIGRNIKRRGVSCDVVSNPVTWEFAREDWNDFIETANIWAVFFWWVFDGKAEIIYGGMTEKDVSFSHTRFLNVRCKLMGINR